MWKRKLRVNKAWVLFLQQPIILKILRWPSDLLFRSTFFYRLSFLLRCREARKYNDYFFIIFHFLLLFANTLFHVRRPFVLWSFTLLICRVVYQWSGPHMKRCFTDDTPPRAMCKTTFYICINNLVFAEQKFIIASREKKEACKTVNVTGLTSVNDAKLSLSHL